MTARALPPESLRAVVDPDGFAFRTTAELTGAPRTVGQQRALDALRFGIGMPGSGFNIFAVGPDGVGKFTLVRSQLQQVAADRPVPDDWVYVFDFEQPARPHALRLPHGLGIRLREGMARIVEGMRTALPAAFRRDDYQARHQEIEEEFQTRQQEALNALRERARQQHVMLIETPNGFAFAPVDEHGEAISPIRFQKMAPEEQARVEAVVTELQEELQRTVRQFPAWYREMHDKLRGLRREIAEFAVGNLVDSVLADFAALPNARAYLERVRKDIVDHADAFLPAKESPLAELMAGGEDPLDRYRVNLLIDHRERTSAPVEQEDLPTLGNLIGRSEYRSRMGTLMTDFTLIRPGALHRANGGFLLLDARRVLSEPYAWEALKRALRAREIRIEGIERQLGLLSTASLEPEAIPLDIKVVLFGEPLLYYLLQTYDPDFAELFKVLADFDDSTPRTDDAVQAFAGNLAALAAERGLRPLDRGAVARVIEHANRLAGDIGRLSVHARSLSDLLREADYWAGQAGRAIVERADVQRAVDQQIYRAERLRARIYETIAQRTIRIAVEGEVAGQINGLSVLELGGFAFGVPTRITATTRVGEGELVDIERETELGGALHSKGVLILSSFLASRYAREEPLSVAASIVFEQSYGPVEGDSASLAELCALMSSLARVPIRQRFAVTGSVDQFGAVQAIGGVNEKIEGFFDVCRQRGELAGHGVLIPAANVRHLMLREEVVAAVRAGAFSVHAVDSVDDAMAVLTGLPAGAADEAGSFPADSLNGRVAAGLGEFVRRRVAFAREAQEGGGHGHHD